MFHSLCLWNLLIAWLGHGMSCTNTGRTDNTGASFVTLSIFRCVGVRWPHKIQTWPNSKKKTQPPTENKYHQRHALPAVSMAQDLNQRSGPRQTQSTTTINTKTFWRAWATVWLWGLTSVLIAAGGRGVSINGKMEPYIAISQTSVAGKILECNPVHSGVQAHGHSIA